MTDLFPGVAEIRGQDLPVLEALTSPTVLDVTGNLYVLRSDGATVRLDRPGDDGTVCFIRSQTQAKSGWIATNERLYWWQDAWKSAAAIAIEHHLAFQRVVPVLSPVFAIQSVSGALSTVGISSSNKVSVLHVHGDVSATSVEGVHCLGGWTSDSRMTLVGCDVRGEHHDTESYKRARGRILAVNWPTGNRVKNVRLSSDVAADIDRFLDGRYPRVRSSSPVVESWLSAHVLAAQTYLIGGIAETNLPENDWGLGPTPHHLDYSTFVVYDYQPDNLQPIAFLHPNKYFGSCTTPDSLLVFSAKWERSRRTMAETLEVLRVESGSGSAKSYPMKIDGLESTHEVSFLDVRYDERIGLYGSISLQRGLYQHDSYLMRSVDGREWSIVHALGLPE